MTVPVAQTVTLTADGRTVLVQRFADGCTMLFYPRRQGYRPGLQQVALSDCVQGLYGPDGSLLASFNDEDA